MGPIMLAGEQPAPRGIRSGERGWSGHEGLPLVQLLARDLRGRPDAAAAVRRLDGRRRRHPRRRLHRPLDRLPPQARPVPLGRRRRGGDRRLRRLRSQRRVLLFRLPGLAADPPGALRRRRRPRRLPGMHDAVDDVGRVCQKEGIDAHHAKEGELEIVRSAYDLSTLHAMYDEFRAIGPGPLGAARRRADRVAGRARPLRATVGEQSSHSPQAPWRFQRPNGCYAGSRSNDRCKPWSVSGGRSGRRSRRCICSA